MCDWIVVAFKFQLPIEQVFEDLNFELALLIPLSGHLSTLVFIRVEQSLNKVSLNGTANLPNLVSIHLCRDSHIVLLFSVKELRLQLFNL